MYSKKELASANAEASIMCVIDAIEGIEEHFPHFVERSGHEFQLYWERLKREAKMARDDCDRLRQAFRE